MCGFHVSSLCSFVMGGSNFNVALDATQNVVGL